MAYKFKIFVHLTFIIAFGVIMSGINLPINTSQSDIELSEVEVEEEESEFSVYATVNAQESDYSGDGGNNNFAPIACAEINSPIKKISPKTFLNLTVSKTKAHSAPFYIQFCSLIVYS